MHISLNIVALKHGILTVSFISPGVFKYHKTNVLSLINNKTLSWLLMATSLWVSSSLIWTYLPNKHIAHYKIEVVVIIKTINYRFQNIDMVTFQLYVATSKNGLFPSYAELYLYVY